MFSRRFRRLSPRDIIGGDVTLRRPSVAEALAVASASFIASFYVSGETILLAAGLALGGLAIASSLPARAGRVFIAGIRLEFMIPGRIVEGEVRTGRLLVENRTLNPMVLKIILKPEEGLEVEPERAEVHAPPLSRRSISLVVKPRFGRYKLIASIEEARSPLGLWSLQPEQPQTAVEVLATPKPEVVSEDISVLTGPGSLDRGREGSGLDYRSFREYQPGDDPRSIEWKLTGRRGAPVVREVEGAESSKPVRLVLAIRPQHYRKPLYNSPYGAAARRLYTISMMLAEEGVRHSVLLPGARGFQELEISTPRDTLELGLALAIYTPEDPPIDYAYLIEDLARRDSPVIVVSPKGTLGEIVDKDRVYVLEV
ncbi:DUF58 domain-containing protein [Aeropyrum pernix]|nr:DUF58 domain-containing protein [Aeropyrum pernix]